MFDWCHVLFVFAVSFALASFGLLLLYGLLMRAQILLLAFAVVLLALVWGLKLIAVIIVDCCVSEVHLMLYLSHALSLLNSKLLAFLVPTPFVRLAHLEPRPLANFKKSLFRPMGIQIKLTEQQLHLVLIFPLSFPNLTPLNQWHKLLCLY